MTQRGHFITFEGIDGAGKSTQIALLSEHLRAAGKHVVVTREPGGTPLAEALRELVLHSDEAICPDSETLIMFAARAQHVHGIILPALKQGHIVICSRFSDATLAYQGYGRGVDLARINELIAWTHSHAMPDLTLVLDIKPDLALKRRTSRGERSDRFEREHINFMRRVRDGYLAIASANSKRCQCIDADQPSEVIAAEIRHRVSFLS